MDPFDNGCYYRWIIFSVMLVKDYVNALLTIPSTIMIQKSNPKAFSWSL